jgi:hypothetical protein
VQLENADLIVVDVRASAPANPGAMHDRSMEGWGTAAIMAVMETVFGIGRKTASARPH